MPDIKTIVIFGASGLVGCALKQVVARRHHRIQIIVPSSRKEGGPDLADCHAWETLMKTVILSDPASTVVIHAAAMVAWDEPRALVDNPLMAWNVARWAALSGVAHAHYISTVSVISDAIQAGPSNLYGIGKLAAEHVWVQQLGQERSGISRLAGVLDWKNPHGMFWSKLLHAAGNPETATRLRYNPASVRNYVTAQEAAECILVLAMGQTTGVHLVAGQEDTSLAEFVAQLRQLAGRELPFDAGESVPDPVHYSPSNALATVLRPFRERLAELWHDS
jgi:nucleoside-diphosphate-sugar epimerase